MLRTIGNHVGRLLSASCPLTQASAPKLKSYKFSFALEQQRHFQVQTFRANDNETETNISSVESDDKPQPLVKLEEILNLVDSKPRFHPVHSCEVLTLLANHAKQPGMELMATTLKAFEDKTDLDGVSKQLGVVLQTLDNAQTSDLDRVQTKSFVSNIQSLIDLDALHEI